MIRIWGERIKPLSLAGWHSGVERGGGGTENLRFSPSLSLPFLALTRQAIGPLWLLSFSLLLKKKLNNGIHWISLCPLVNAIGFPTPGIWPLNLPGEPSWRERRKISMRVFQIINTCGIILSNPQYSQEFSIIKNTLNGLFLLAVWTFFLVYWKCQRVFIFLDLIPEFPYKSFIVQGPFKDYAIRDHTW